MHTHIATSRLVIFLQNMNVVSFMLRTILKFQTIDHLSKDAMLCTYWEFGDTKNYK